ncbi:MAG: hypothetical protein PHS92_04440 [Candidatus Gracilibacteria bacterium]|nr:hypothetical protein [Candidatus Gracilibacteria bacterium]
MTLLFNLMLNINTVAHAIKPINEMILNSRSGNMNKLYRNVIPEVTVHNIYENMFALCFLGGYKSFIVVQYAITLTIPTQA